MTVPPTRLGIDAGAFALDSQVALVTGASRNIGAAIAATFAAAGADVLLVARGEERLNATAEIIRRQSPQRRVETFTADITARDQVDALAQEARARLGHVDILVNNAFASGLDANVDVLDVPDATWSEVLEANVLGPLHLIRSLVPAMRTAGRPGNVINLVSGNGLLPNSARGPLPVPTLAPYGVAKAALWMLTRYLANELAPDVRVNALCPGLISEGGAAREEESYERLLRSGAVPMGRGGTPEEVAGAALYLASPAASYTTGELLVCNGGRAW